MLGIFVMQSKHLYDIVIFIFLFIMILAENRLLISLAKAFGEDMSNLCLYANGTMSIPITLYCLIINYFTS